MFTLGFTINTCQNTVFQFVSSGDQVHGKLLTIDFLVREINVVYVMFGRNKNTFHQAEKRYFVGSWINVYTINLRCRTVVLSFVGGNETDDTKSKKIIGKKNARIKNKIEYLV